LTAARTAGGEEKAMRKLMSTMVILAFLAALLAASGCQDSPLTAAKDFSISIIAKPSTVYIDPTQGVSQANSTIIATVLDSNGVPQKGISVFFSNTGGVLASGNSAIKTDAGGNAADTLTVKTTDPTDITVTASSGNLNATVKVSKSAVSTNHPPTPVIVATPHTEQVSGRAVVFDGSTSSDVDQGGFIANYKWVITSTAPDTGRANPFIAEGQGVSGLSFPSDTTGPFVNPQDLTVTMIITDNVGAVASLTMPYEIVAVSCAANTAPTAVIAGSPTQTTFGAPGSSVNFLLDGTLSSDAETPIDSWTWNCGNGSVNLPQSPPSKTVCKYTVDSVSRTYTATLVVTDRGTGIIDQSTGQYQCVKQSTPASVQIIVAPIAGATGP
jgi:hypothetical protein